MKVIQNLVNNQSTQPYMDSDNHFYNPKLKDNAISLRREMTKSEACLWKYVLKAGMMCGYTFRRQRPIGYYIADFVCLELKLVIELDGVTHLYEETQIKDIEKDNYLCGQGFEVLRFTDAEVLKELDIVKERIECMVRQQEENILLRPSGTSSKGGHHAAPLKIAKD